MPGYVASAQIALIPSIGAGFSNSIRRLGRELGNDFGKNFIGGLQATIVAGGFASIKFASLYEKEINKVRTLTNTTEKELRQFNVQIGDLGKTTGQGPEKLAAALYSIQSAGLAAQNGMSGAQRGAEVLTQSARLAAIGFGDLKTNAEILTSVLAAWQESFLSAGDASDIFTSAVKESKAEASDFANSLSIVIPIASNMKVSLEETTAALAKMTQTGASASEAATALRGFFNAVLQLQKPTLSKGQKSALETLGLDPIEIRQAIETDLGGALDLLKEKVTAAGADGQAAFQQLIPNVRALTGILSAQSGDGISPVLNNIRQAGSGVGETYRSLLIYQETFQGQLDRVVTAIKAFALETGQKLIPVVIELGRSLAPAADFARIVATTVYDLIQPFKSVIGPVLAATAAIKLFGKLSLGNVLLNGLATIVPRFAALSSAVNVSTGYTARAASTTQGFAQALLNSAGSTNALTVGLASMSPAMFSLGVAGVGVAAVIGGVLLKNWITHKKAVEENNKAIKDMSDGFIAGKSSAEVFAAALENAAKKNKDLQNEITNSSKSNAQIAAETFAADEATFKADIERRRSQIADLQKLREENAAKVAGGVGFGATPEELEANRNLQIQLKEQQAALDSTSKAYTSLRAQAIKSFEDVIEKAKQAGKLSILTNSADVVKTLSSYGDGFKNVQQFIDTFNDSTKSAEDRQNALNQMMLKAQALMPGSTTDLHEVAGAARDLADSSLSAADAIDTATKSLRDMLGITDTFKSGQNDFKLDDLISSILGIQKADSAVAEAQQKVADAGTKLREASRKDQEKILKDQVDANNRKKSLREAQDKVDNARRDIQTNKDKQAQDEINLREAKRKLNIEFPREQLAAEEALTRAKQDYINATIAVEEAENNLSDSRKDILDSTIKLKNAKDDLPLVEDKARLATDALRKAQDALNNKQYDLIKSSRDVEKAQFNVVEKLHAVAAAQHEVVDSVNALQSKQAEAGKVAFELVKAQQAVVDALLAVNRAQFDTVKATDDITKAQLEVRKSTADVVKAQRDQRDSYDKVGEAVVKVNDAQSGFNKVVKETGDNSRDALNAINALRDAQLGLRSSVLDVADAQDKLNKARVNLSIGVEGKTRAELIREVQRAEIDLARSRNSLSDQKQTVSDRRADITSVPADQAVKRADALKKVTDAQKELSDAQFDASQTGLAIVQAQGKVRTATLGVKDAQLKQIESFNGVEKALLAVKAAELGVGDARQAQIEFARQVADASFKITEAEFSLLKARQDVKEATDSVADAEQARIQIQQDIVNLTSDVLTAEMGIKEANKEIRDYKQNLLDQQADLDKKIRDVAIEERKIQDLVLKQTEAKNGVRDAQIKLNDMVHDHQLREEAVSAAEKVVAADKEAVVQAQKRLVEALEDQADLIVANKLAEIKSAKEVVDAKKAAAADLDKAQATLDEAKKSRDDEYFKASFKYPSVFGKGNLTENQMLLERYNQLQEYLKQIKDPVMRQGVRDLFDAGLKTLDVLTSTNTIQDHLNQVGKNVTLAVKTVVDDQANLLIGLGGKVVSTSPLSSGSSVLGGGGGSLNGAILGGRKLWTGGPVLAGTGATVNERGPEQFWSARTGRVVDIVGPQQNVMFGEDGYVIPNHARVGGGYVDARDMSTHSYSIMSTVSDPSMAARQWERQRRQQSRRSSR